MSKPEKLWEPSRERIERSRMFEFMARVSKRYGFEPTWTSLHEWSIANPGEFWGEMFGYADIKASTAHQAVMSGEGMLGTAWFDGIKFNYAQHMLRFDDDSDAIIFESELGRQIRYTHHQLREEVARTAAAMARDGVTPGDRVAGFLPNIPETVISMLAATSLGAVWSSCSPDFGVDGVLDRFSQIEPSILVVADGYSYNGKRIDLRGRVGELMNRLPSVRRLVVVPYLDDDVKLANGVSGEGSGTVKPMLWRDYLGPLDQAAPDLQFAEVSFDHPLFIMYSSGTTGIPKCIVHGHGGTLLQHTKELILHTDVRPGERIFYFTTCGWMMWNWLVSSIGIGAAVVLYDGSPTYPNTNRLWDLTSRWGINVFGTSPKFLAACQSANLHPGKEHDLSALRTVLSTGSPLSAEQFRWVYQEVKSDIQLASISGGTDIISCFMLGNPLLAVWAGEIQCCGLGMDVQAWDDSGRSVLGKKGELVCCTPFPSQPVRFWNDPGNVKYEDAYFGHFTKPGRGTVVSGSVGNVVWRHGDFIEFTTSGGVIVHGRSDATLNPGGIRIGTGEIYRIVEGLPEVIDSIAVSKSRDDGDVEIALFVVLGDDCELGEVLTQRICKAIAEGATRRHVPRYIKRVSAIPYTVSGKKVELAVRQMIHGQEVVNRDALANPQALEEFGNVFGADCPSVCAGQ